MEENQKIAIAAANLICEKDSFCNGQCGVQHGDFCEICGFLALNKDPEQRANHIIQCKVIHPTPESYAEPRSCGKSCSICLEEVRSTSTGKYGILNNCNHVFCQDCIFTWRTKPTESETERLYLKKCPVCRITSVHCVSFRYWPYCDNDKERLMQAYMSAFNINSLPNLSPQEEDEVLSVYNEIMLRISEALYGDNEI